MSEQMQIDCCPDAPVGWVVVELSSKTLKSGRISQRETRLYGVTPVREAAETYMRMLRATGRDCFIKALALKTK